MSAWLPGPVLPKSAITWSAWMSISDKIERLNNGEVPIYEPGLDELIAARHGAGRIEFTTDLDKAVGHGLFQMIAVGTPPGEDGSADLQYVLAVAESIGQHMDDYKIIIDKSTVPVGTASKVRDQGRMRSWQSARSRSSLTWYRIRNF